MIKQCTGTRTLDGCSEYKLEDEFSNSNKNMCKVCEGEHRRAKYEKENRQTRQNDEDSKLFKQLITKPWV